MINNLSNKDKELNPSLKDSIEDRDLIIEKGKEGISEMLKDRFDNYSIGTWNEMMFLLNKIYKAEDKYFRNDEDCGSMHCGESSRIILNCLAGKDEIKRINLLNVFRCSGYEFFEDSINKKNLVKFFELVKRETGEKLADEDIRYIFSKMIENTDYSIYSSDNVTCNNIKEKLGEQKTILDSFEGLISKDDFFYIRENGLDNKIEHKLTAILGKLEFNFSPQTVEKVVDCIGSYADVGKDTYNSDVRNIIINYKKVIELLIKYLEEFSGSAKEFLTLVNDMEHGWGHTVAVVEYKEKNKREDKTIIIDFNSDQFGEEFDKPYFFEKKEAMNMGYFIGNFSLLEKEDYFIDEHRGYRKGAWKNIVEQTELIKKYVDLESDKEKKEKKQSIIKLLLNKIRGL